MSGDLDHLQDQEEHGKEKGTIIQEILAGCANELSSNKLFWETVISRRLHPAIVTWDDSRSLAVRASL
jgi:hypothetical protein